MTTSAVLRDLQDFRNEEVWSCFTRRFSPAIARFLRRMGVPEAECEDVSQEILLSFAKAWAERRYDRSRGGLRTWLFSIAYRRAVDHARRRSSRTQRFPREEGLRAAEIPDVSSEAASQEIFDHEWERRVLEECLRRARGEVRARTWSAFEAVVLHERDPNEVAEELGLSRNAVYIAKFRVMQRLEKLREEMENERDLAEREEGR